MTSTKLDFSFKKNLPMKSPLSFITSSQVFLLSNMGVEGGLMLKKSLSPKSFDQGTAFSFLAQCLA